MAVTPLWAATGMFTWPKSFRPQPMTSPLAGTANGTARALALFVAFAATKAGCRHSARLASRVRERRVMVIRRFMVFILSSRVGSWFQV
jgi:hypothetical protein